MLLSWSQGITHRFQGLSIFKAVTASYEIPQLQHLFLKVSSCGFRQFWPGTRESRTQHNSLFKNQCAGPVLVKLMDPFRTRCDQRLEPSGEGRRGTCGCRHSCGLLFLVVQLFQVHLFLTCKPETLVPTSRGCWEGHLGEPCCCRWRRVCLWPLLLLSAFRWLLLGIGER